MTDIKRFTAYRTDMDNRDTHTELQKNPESEPQFEGVIWSDGTVTLRWLTALRSHSVWGSLADCLGIHGHPEYGTEIVWHDHNEPPSEWMVLVEGPTDEEMSLYGKGQPKTLAELE